MNWKVNFGQYEFFFIESKGIGYRFAPGGKPIFQSRANLFFVEYSTKHW
jgi:hypothetical protein